MEKQTKCVNCGKEPRIKIGFVPCDKCGRTPFRKCKTLEELANEENLRDDQMVDFVPNEMDWKPMMIKGRILYVDRGLIHED